MRFFRRTNAWPDFVRAYLDAPRPHANQNWRELRYAVLDIETSGLDTRRDALLAIGLVEIVHGRVLVESAWHTLVRPPEHLRIAADSIRIHGLLRADLSQAPPPDEVLPELFDRLCGRVLVAHVAAIDIGFLNRLMGRRYGVRLRGPAIDTARLAAKLAHDERFAHGNAAAPPTIALRALAEQAGLPGYAEHNPLDDALTTAQLFLVLAARLEQRGITSLKGFLRFGGYVR